MLYSGSGVVFLLSLVSLPLPSLFVSVTSWDLIKKIIPKAIILTIRAINKILFFFIEPHKNMVLEVKMEYGI